MHAYIAAHKTITSYSQSPGQRHTLQMQSVSCSFDLLEKLLESPISDSMILVTLFFKV
jgi:hypothetical protein